MKRHYADHCCLFAFSPNVTVSDQPLGITTLVSTQLTDSTHTTQRNSHVCLDAIQLDLQFNYFHMSPEQNHFPRYRFSLSWSTSDILALYLNFCLCLLIFVSVCIRWGLCCVWGASSVARNVLFGFLLLLLLLFVLPHLLLLLPRLCLTFLKTIFPLFVKSLLSPVAEIVGKWGENNLI